jgi:hypothetical protein
MVVLHLTPPFSCGGDEATSRLTSGKLHLINSKTEEEETSTKSFSQKFHKARGYPLNSICVSGRQTRPDFGREFFATGLDVVDETEGPFAPINDFSSVGVYELKVARANTDQVELDIGTMNLQTLKSHSTPWATEAPSVVSTGGGMPLGRYFWDWLDMRGISCAWRSGSRTRGRRVHASFGGNLGAVGGSQTDGACLGRDPRTIWAMVALGKHEGGTAKLDEAVAAFRETLKEWTRERVPLDWARRLGKEGVAPLARMAD